MLFGCRLSAGGGIKPMFEAADTQRLSPMALGNWSPLVAFRTGM